MHPFMRQINVTSRCATLYRERELADTGLAGCQTPYLSALYRLPGLTQEELARELNVNKSNVTRQLNNLEEKGYVRREPSREDRRMVRVFPTEKALALQPRLRQVHLDWSNYLTADFTPEERENLSRLMIRIAARAEAYVKGDASACAPSENT